MLHRASKHSKKLEAYKYWQTSLDALYLPWLCPFLYVSTRSGSRKTSTVAPARFATFSPSCLFKSNQVYKCGLKRTRRGLASAINAGYDISQDHHIPFEALDTQARTQLDCKNLWTPSATPTVSPTFDPDSALIINTSRISTPPRFRAVNAISGEVTEILQTVRACVQVDRFERSATLMRRLNQLYRSDALELVAVHNDYLRELIHKARHSKDSQILRRIHKWFEVDLRGIGVVPNALTYALMTQAALQESSPKRVDRTVKRYMFLADEAGVRDNVMQLILAMSGDQSTGRITEIAPTLSQFTALSAGQHHDSAPAVKLSDIPKIKETLTKGSGMATLKASLIALSDQIVPPDDLNASLDPESHESRSFKRQQQLEAKTYESAIERWRLENQKLVSLGVNVALTNGTISGLIWTWHEKLSALIKEEMQQANQAENAHPKKTRDIDRCLYGPFLQILPAEKLSAITILTCTNYLCLMGQRDVHSPLAALLRALGTAVADESFAETIRKDGDHRLWESLDSRQRVNRLIKLRRQQNPLARPLAQGSPSEERMEGLRWTGPTKVRVAAVLVSHLLRAARIGVSSTDPRSGKEVRESQPAFIHSFMYNKGNRVGTLRFNRALSRKLAQDPVSCAIAKYLPMLVEPRPWVGYRDGAFLSHAGRAVRPHTIDFHSMRYAKTASENGDMDTIFAGLDVLAKTPWRISRELFEVMVAGWNSGEELGKIPPAQPNIPYPPEPPPEAGESARVTWHYYTKDIENKIAGIHSVRCFQNFQMEVARAYLDEVFYFPHNVDFRGRAYPMVPLFNHMGADPARSLLIFAKGKELGEKGLRWLKIHLASLYGLTKKTLEDRVKFTEQHLSEIFESATRPLEGSRWWLKAEDPWQCLGACMELKRALDSPDPRRFVSHLPIHQDGTCNGLQHYAALGGDVLGAKQVNLIPGDRPADVYSAIADMVRAEIVADANQGDEMAKLLQDHIIRKVVKQTVMTNVYGVTFGGASKQVRRQLEALEIVFPDKQGRYYASFYIARKIFKALSTSFFGATEIQHWLLDCAQKISHAVTPEQILTLRKPSDSNIAGSSPFGSGKRSRTSCKQGPKKENLFLSAIIWTNPLKMPVVQPYRENLRQHVRTNLQTLAIISPSVADPCDSRKQCQGFPPNFIHSLDASHMMLTALKCNEMGLTFAAVHDSFWTHAADVDTMAEILREAFVRMHSEDIIGRLRAEFMVRYKDCWRLLSIRSNSKLGNEVKQWRRRNHDRKAASTAGTKMKIPELLLEARRQELLKSDKPEERLEGQSMITPSKIYSELADTDYMLVSAGQITEEDEDVPPTEPHTDAEEDSASREEFAEHLPHEGLPSNAATASTNNIDEDISLSRPKKKQTTRTWLWVPLEFLPVPKKGNLNISDVKDSKYFFC